MPQKPSNQEPSKTHWAALQKRFFSTIITNDNINSILTPQWCKSQGQK